MGQRIEAVERRGKFWWLLLDGGAALAGHLGMSGQWRVGGADDAHTRVVLDFDDDLESLRFVDQRTFGWLAVQELVLGRAGRLVPEAVAQIAVDPFEPGYQVDAVARALRQRRSGVKSALLDQQLVAGIGNIYADEALWRARLHWATPADRLRQRTAVALLEAAAEVMTEAMAAGGTSFDSLYVNVNGSSGYFARSLAAYGREDEPCPRCGQRLVRESFGNRSSYRCRRCQRRPRGLAQPA